MEQTLFGLNKIIQDNSEKIQQIYGFVKLFEQTNVTESLIEEKTKEITTHFLKSTDSRSLHQRSLGVEQTKTSALILAGFNLNLYNCEYVDIETGAILKDYECDLLETKDNNYFNMILNWYKMKSRGFDDIDISEDLNLMYDIYIQANKQTKSNCSISG